MSRGSENATDLGHEIWPRGSETRDQFGARNPCQKNIEIWSSGAEKQDRFQARNPCPKSDSQNWHHRTRSLAVDKNAPIGADFPRLILGTDSVPKIGLVFVHRGTRFRAHLGMDSVPKTGAGPRAKLERANARNKHRFSKPNGARFPTRDGATAMIENGTGFVAKAYLCLTTLGQTSIHPRPRCIHKTDTVLHRTAPVYLL